MACVCLKSGLDSIGSNCHGGATDKKVWATRCNLQSDRDLITDSLRRRRLWPADTLGSLLLFHIFIKIIKHIL